MIIHLRILFVSIVGDVAMILIGKPYPTLVHGTRLNLNFEWHTVWNSSENSCTSQKSFRYTAENNKGRECFRLTSYQNKKHHLQMFWLSLPLCPARGETPKGIFFCAVVLPAQNSVSHGIRTNSNNFSLGHRIILRIPDETNHHYYNKTSRLSFWA